MLRSLLVLLCAFTVVAPVAAAQEEGVVVDPGSPSGKEYALPVDRARAQAAKGGRSEPDSQKAPLFGEGVEGSGPRPTSGRGGSPAARRSGSRDGAGGAGGTSSRVDAPESDGSRSLDTAPTSAQRAVRAQAASADGGLGVGASIGAGAGVLLLGGLIGLWLRRRAMP